MHYTRVKMKDGTVYESPIWMRRPKEGFFTLVNDGSIPERIYFRDVESAVTKGERIRKDLIADQDELERAREDGWDGT